MANELLAAAVLAWIAGGVLALIGRPLGLVRILLAAGGVAAIVACAISLPGGTPAVAVPLQIAGEGTAFSLAPEALWLLEFGLVPGVLACLLTTPAEDGRALWLFGAAISLLGALGVFGIQNAAFLLVAWELMSLGAAILILSERLAPAPGQPVLFMLGMLEVGSVALLIALLVLAVFAGSLDFSAFAAVGARLPIILQAIVALLLVIGFGAKLGLLPFYEWFPGAYGAGSGASGALLSGVVLNAAFFALGRGLLDWLPIAGAGGGYGLGSCVIAVGVVSAILAVLYAFQQEDWRCLLAFSTAENAGIAVSTLGACLLFREAGLGDLADLALTVSLLHLAGHALAKGGLFLTADGVYAATGRYLIRHSLLVRRISWVFGVGALFAAMSLAAMPPQAGFVSEWFVFQTVFQGFHMPTLAGRLVLALAGAGLALTAAIAFATFIKVFGIGILGGAPSDEKATRVSGGIVASVGLLGLGVLALAVAMPALLGNVVGITLTHPGTASLAPQQMRDGWILVPLTAKFAFISPSLLVIVMPLLALVPILLLLASRRFPVRRVPVWYGGVHQDAVRTATTALTFSNALRTFYSFIYRPTVETSRESVARDYFIRRLVFTAEVAPIFGPLLFGPSVRLVRAAADRVRVLQSGHLNLYLGLIGALLVLILGLALL